jgi:protein ImuB
MRRRILCLYLPQWPIQRLRGELKKAKVRRTKDEGSDNFVLRPSSFALILHARDPRRGDVVAVCDAAADERGVRVGMPLAEAAALARHGGKCLIWPHDPAGDLAELARLAERCERFSPIVGWRTVQGPKSKVQSSQRSDFGPGTLDFGPMTGPDCLFLDVTGIGVLFGGEEELGGEVVAELKRLGYEVRVAVADTIGAAWASAKYEGRSIKDENGDTFLLCPSSFVLSALRLPTQTVDLLSQLGVERLEQLLALPRESLRARFGELLLLRVDQFLGAAQEMIVPYRPPPQFSEEWLLEYPAEQREVVERILRGLVQRVATALANRREGVLKLGCRLNCVPGRPVLLEVGLFRPSADPEHLWDLLQMQLEQATLPGPVGRLRLEATLTAPLENRQGELFAGGEHEAQRQLALLIDRCSSRLGTRAVLRPELTADPLPERGARYRSTKYEGQRTKGTGRRTKEKGKEGDRFISSFVLRPLSLFSPPQELQVLSVAPDGPPVSFRWKGKTHEVAGSAGPERIETGWWRGRSVRRDYWRVETASGQRFWLFRQLTNGRWFLHGEY